MTDEHRRREVAMRRRWARLSLATLRAALDAVGACWAYACTYYDDVRPEEHEALCAVSLRLGDLASHVDSALEAIPGEP